MAVPPSSDISLLINAIFEKYDKYFENPENRINSTTSINDYKDFFAELYFLFGEVFAAALHIVDTKAFTIYTTEATSRRQLAEIHLGQCKVVKLYPQVNFCFCDHFQRHVLQLTAPTNPQSYTCEHVLALRLAQLLRVPTLAVEYLPKEKFNLLLSQMKPY